jgi:hypothetical protein|tara:strand:+ start:211 stop:435 length:225 start_codon:yes stop_codon:yes gene_type:complete
MKLSNQAIGAIMMALQKSLLEQQDIVPMLKNMSLVRMDDGELLVENPPVVKSPSVKSTETDNSAQPGTTFHHSV